MSKYSLNTTGSILGDKIRITCKVCDRISSCGKNEDPKSKRCGYCGHNFGTKLKSYIDDVPNASSETHFRYSWFCSSCECRGLKWVEKALDLASCPNCNAPLPSHVTRQIDPIKGRCKTIWESEEDISIGHSIQDSRASLKTKNCVTCGRAYSYRAMPPYRCEGCGETGPNFRLIQPLKNSVIPLPQPKMKSLDCPACGFKHFLSSPDVCSGCGSPLKITLPKGYIVEQLPPERKIMYITCSACGFHNSLPAAKLCSACGRILSKASEAQI